MKTIITFIMNVLFIVVFMSGRAKGQSENFQHTPEGMQSPTAASLGKFGDIPVNLYTGTPDIRIPLHEAAGVKLSLPIQLKYHASGIKVRDIAGWVGLGWALDAGGVVTRTVKGIPDEITNGYLDTRNNLNPNSDSELMNVISGIKFEQIDPEPDMFYYHFAGRSGKFLMTDEGMTSTKVYGEPVSDTQIKIEWNNPNSTTNTNKFVITVEDGTRFIFAEREIVTDYGGLSYWDRSPYIASWYLTRIESPQSQEVIDIEYEIDSSFYSFVQHISSQEVEKIDCSHSSAIYPQEQASLYPYYHEITRQPILKTIRTQAETIDFSSDLLRDDPGKVKLNTISILRNGSLVKKFELGYTDNNPGATEESERRLLLDTVTEVGRNGEIKPPYTFVYDNAPLPDRLSYGIDYWGYYNGKDYNSTLVPAYKNLSGADRDPSFPEMRAGSLTKIIYPTGGSTEFIYEPHTYNWIGANELSDELFYESKSATASAGGTHPMGVVLDDTASFTIDHSHEVEINYTLTCNDPQICDGSPTYVMLKNQNGSVLRSYYLSPGGSRSGIDYLYVNTGNYTIEAHAVEYTDPALETAYTYASIRVDYTTEEVIVAERNKPAGGLRIAKIIDNSGLSGNPIVREFKYYMPDDPLKSSGVLVSKPVHYYSGYVDLVTETDTRVIGESCFVEFRSSNSTIPLGSTQGSHIGYQYVTTIFGANEEGGRKRSKFITARDEPDEIPMNGGTEKPGRWTSKDWERGVMVDERMIKQNGDLLKKTSYGYNAIELTVDTQLYPNQPPTYPVIHFSQFVHPPAGIYGQLYLYLISEIEAERGVKLKTDKTTRTYNADQSSFAEHSEAYSYNENQSQPSFGQLTTLIRTNSDGQVRKTTYEYAHEQYPGMQSNHMLTQPYQVTVRDGSNSILRIAWTLWDQYNTGSGTFWHRCEEWIGGPELGTSTPIGCN